MSMAAETLLERLRLLLQGPPGSVDLTQALAGQHPADIAEAMSYLDPQEDLAVFRALDSERAAEVLAELDSGSARLLLESEPSGRVAELLDRLAMDDAAEVVSEATPARAESLLADLTARAPADAAEVRELLSYGEATAGRLLTDKFLRLRPSMRVEEALDVVRRADRDIETVTDLYVVLPSPRSVGQERLIGVLSLRELIQAEPGRRVEEIMVSDVVSVSVDTDQQVVARVISKYDFLAIPVLDREGDLAGIITVDDVIDVLVEEFNEDLMRMVGSDAEEMERRTPLQVAKLRLPWLMGTMLIELLAGGVISRFDWVLREVILLASFMPVISAISGNVGLQAAAIIVRGLDTGHVSMKNWAQTLAKELMTTLMMAVVCGLGLGLVGAVWSHHLTFGLVIGGAMTCSMLTAGLMGTLIPMLSKKLGFDPATTAGPFETAFQDVVGFAVFLWLASLLLPWLK